MRGPSMDTRVTGSAPGVMQIIQEPTRWIGQPPAGVGGLVVATRKITLAEETSMDFFSQRDGGRIYWSQRSGLITAGDAVLGGAASPLIWGYMPVLPTGHLMIGRTYGGVALWVAPFAAMLLRDAPTHSVAGHAALTLARLI